MMVQNFQSYQNLKNFVCLFQRKPYCEIFQVQIKVGALARNSFIFAKSSNLAKKLIHTVQNQLKIKNKSGRYLTMLVVPLWYS